MMVQTCRQTSLFKYNCDTVAALLHDIGAAKYESGISNYNQICIHTFTIMFVGKPHP